jgi:hypothetical protein
MQRTEKIVPRKGIEIVDIWIVIVVILRYAGVFIRAREFGEEPFVILSESALSSSSKGPSCCMSLSSPLISTSEEGESLLFCQSL